MDEPRGHHYVPQFYLRAFANAREQMVVRRRDGSKQYFATVKAVAKRRDFYMMETADGTSFAVERQIGKLEERTAPVLKQMAKGNLPRNDDEREMFASFVALQFVRGLDQRKAVENLMIWNGRFILKNLTSTMVEDTIRKAENREPDPGEIDELLKFSERDDIFPRHLVPHQNHTIVMALGLLEVCARIAFDRTLRVLRWNEPRLLTSDTPVALYSSSPPPPMTGLGFGTADQIVLPLSRYSAAVLYAPHLKQPETIWEEPDLRFAAIINHLVADNAMESIFVHPDDTKILSGLVELPPVRDRGVVSPERPFRIAPPR